MRVLLTILCLVAGPLGCAENDVDCEALKDSLTIEFEEAVLCNPGSSDEQCSGATMIRTVCGCEWAAAESSEAKALSARRAWVLYEGAGCLAETSCGQCPETARTFSCQRLPVGTDGTCEITR